MEGLDGLSQTIFRAECFPGGALGVLGSESCKCFHRVTRGLRDACREVALPARQKRKKRPAKPPQLRTFVILGITYQVLDENLEPVRDGAPPRQKRHLKRRGVLRPYPLASFILPPPPGGPHH